MPFKFPMNRVLIVLHIIIVVGTGLVALIAGLAKDLPGIWTNAALSIAGVITSIVGVTTVVFKYLTGSQKWDALTVNQGSNGSSNAPPEMNADDEWSPDLAPPGAGHESKTPGTASPGTTGTGPRLA